MSESSHYKVLADNGNLNFKLKHLESGDMVYIGKEYIHNYLESADDFTNEVKVTREAIRWIILGGTKYVVE